MSSYHARYSARIGVLAGNVMHLPGTTFTVPADVPLRGLCSASNLDQLWLWPDGSEYPPEISHWDQHGNEPAIVRPALDTAAPWRDAATPQELRSALQLFNDALGRPYAYSPARTGAVLADATMPRPRQAVEEWPAPATRPNTVSDPSMVRELADVPAGSWLHCYDKNAMYLAACSSVELGLGRLEHRVLTTFNAAPGYWQRNNRWYTTPELQWLIPQGESGSVFTEAFVWTDHNRALRNWYERIRDARAVLMDAAAIRTPGAALALRVLKLVYVMTIGWWASTRGRDEASTQYRPDWRHMIMATAHANMRRQIAKCDAAGTPPIAWVGVDTLCFLCEEGPLPVLPALTFGDGVGQWKHKCTLPPATVDAIWSLSGRERVRALVREIEQR